MFSANTTIVAISDRFVLRLMPQLFFLCTYKVKCIAFSVPSFLESLLLSCFQLAEDGIVGLHLFYIVFFIFCSDTFQLDVLKIEG